MKKNLLFPPKGEIVQKEFGKIEEAAESSVGNPSVMVGCSIIGLLALRSNHTFGKCFWTTNEAWEGGVLLNYDDRHHSRCDRNHIIRAFRSIIFP
jgi:hypothetical protein